MTGTSQLLTDSDRWARRRGDEEREEDLLSAAILTHRLESVGQPWSFAAQIRVKEFSYLDEDWDNEGSSAVALEAIDAALHVIPRLSPLPRPIIAPTQEGGVAFEWRGTAGFVVLEVSSETTWHLHYWAGEEEFEGPLAEARVPLGLLVARVASD